MYKHILIATDSSQLAGKAVEAGLALRKRLGTKVTAVTAIEPRLSIASSDTAAAFMEYQNAAEHDAAPDYRPRQELQDHHEARHNL
jgi:nucleotide-binding universal stress UspA family protein